MLFALLADAVVLFHLAFVLFVVAGGLVVLRWRRLMWIHLLAAAWGAGVEFSGWPCPLTPLEQWLRTSAGSDAYETDFLAYYLLPLLYPAGLTRDAQYLLGTLVITVNGAVYALLWRNRHHEAT